MNEKDTLNILNGQSMHDYFRQHHFDENGVFVPFNEAMCVGKVTSDIFSNEFNKYRCDSLHVTLEHYNELTLKPLQMLFENQFSRIALWFDDDMFCQINLLTLLAYLDQINYGREATFNLVNRKFEVINCYEIDVQGYYEIYKQVMINKCVPQNIKLSVMENGIRLYFEYLKEKNEITTYIRRHADLQNRVLVAELLKVFCQYGLGDTQYMQLIQAYRSHNR